MAKPNIITAIDVGSSKIRTVVASIKEGEEKPRIIGTGESISNGVSKGMIRDIEATTESIGNSVKQAELNSGFSIKHAYVSIGGSHIDTRTNKGAIAVSRADQKISEEDVLRAIDSASDPSSLALPLNRELLYVTPREFKVDDEANIQDPLGMTGIKLEADVLIVDGLTPCIKNLTKCFSNLEIKIDSMVLDILAASQSVLSKSQKEVGVLVLDLGGGTTGMAIYEESKLLYTRILPVGANHITNDIAIGLQISIDLAEKVKLEYGSVLSSEIKKKEVFNLSRLDEKEDREVGRLEVAKIIEARVQEIFDLVNRELKKIGKQRLLPGGVVLVGGGALMLGIVEIAKKELGLPAQVGTPLQIEGVVEEVNSPIFTTVSGLILWALYSGRGTGQKLGFLSGVSSASVTVAKIKNWFRNFLP